MARIAVVAYPTVDQQTLDWIESIRVRHDPQASRIPPHFTPVFPVDVSPGDIKGEIALACTAYDSRAPLVLVCILHGPTKQVRSCAGHSAPQAERMSN